jgi:oligosaccharyltransferase complex subunit epsilon
MAPKQRQPTSGTAPSTSTPAQSTTTSTSSRSTTSKGRDSGSLDAQEIVNKIWNNYVDKTAQRVKLLDAFMGFLLVVGALQFLYVVIVGNFVR